MPTPLKQPPVFMPPLVRRRRKRRSTHPAPAGPTLVGATYEVGTAVALTFDRAVNIDNLDASRITVDDGQFDQQRYIGASATLGDENTTVTVLLEAEGDPIPAGDVLLNAPANTGIVADENGVAWSGVTDVVLPFGE